VGRCPSATERARRHRCPGAGRCSERAAGTAAPACKLSELAATATPHHTAHHLHMMQRSCVQSAAQHSTSEGKPSFEKVAGRMPCGGRGVSHSGRADCALLSLRAAASRRRRRLHRPHRLPIDSVGCSCSRIPHAGVLVCRTLTKTGRWVDGWSRRSVSNMRSGARCCAARPAAPWPCDVEPGARDGR
jgi:hypothetical protein